MELHVLNREEREDGENWRGKIVQHARDIASYDKVGSELVGFLVIGFFSDGSHSIGFRVDKDKLPFPRRLLPAYVSELIREDVVTIPVVREQME